MVSVPPIRHRVPCVQRKVHDRAADLARVGPHLPEGGLAIDDHFDPLAHQAAQHPVEVRHDDVQVEHLGLQHLTPAECQQLLRKRGRPLAGGLDLKHLFDGGLVPGQRFVKQAAVADDGREQVVEVVSDAASKPADRLHFL